MDGGEGCRGTPPRDTELELTSRASIRALSSPVAPQWVQAGTQRTHTGGTTMQDTTPEAARIHANARKMLTDTRTYMQLLSHAMAAADDERIVAYDRCAAHAERMLDPYGTVTFAFLDDLAFEDGKQGIETWTSRTRQRLSTAGTPGVTAL